MAAKTPAKMMENLYFSKKEVDTRAAMEYVQKYNKKFHSILPPGSKVPEKKVICTDKMSNDIELYNDDLVNPFDQMPLMKTDQGSKLAVVAEKIQQNSNTISQLEFLNRNISIDSVISYDIQFLVTRFMNPQKRDYDLHLGFTNDMALAKLGQAADILFSGHRVYITTNDVNTAAVLHLFVNICHEAGLSVNGIALYFVNKEYVVETISPDDVRRIKNEDYAPGSVFIVTDRTDLDSAVACLTNATHNYQYPWRIRRIIVQESVYELFDQVLFEKTSNVDSDGSFKASLKKYCSRITQYKGKIFIKDYTGPSDLIDIKDPYVFIESYRTTKELLSLLNIKYQPKYISVWCSDVSVANEISLISHAENVWINHFGDFTGFKFLSYYAHAEYWHFQQISDYRYKKVENTQNMNIFSGIVDEVKAKRINWMRLSKESRKNIISEVLHVSNMNDISVVSDDFAFTSSNVLCYGFKKPITGVVALWADLEFETVLKYLIEGNGVIIVCPVGEIINDIVSLRKRGVPVSYYIELIESTVINSTIDFFINIEPVLPAKQVPFKYSLKTVRTRFGETYAN